MKPYVYTLAYPESMGGAVFYVGKGTGNRINDHEAEAKRGKDVNPYKNNIIRKILSMGEQVTKSKLGYFETEEEAFLYEIALIFFMPNLTNLTDGGEGTVGLVYSDELRHTRSEARKGKKNSEETRRKLSEATTRQMSSEEARRKHAEIHIGRKRSEETCRNISEALEGRTAHNKGKTASEEARRKMSESRKASPLAQEQIRKLREANKGRKRPPRSEEWCRKISEAKKANRK